MPPRVAMGKPVDAHLDARTPRTVFERIDPVAV